MQKRLGETTIDRIVETEGAAFERTGFFPDVSSERWSAYHELDGRGLDPVSGALLFTVQSFLIRTRAATIVVDTCVGDDKPRWRPMWNMTSGGTYLRRLREVGVTPEEVDYVVCSHLHADHVGWNTRLTDGSWVPTFPKARYVIDELELAHWQALHQRTPQAHVADSVIPVIEAGQAWFVSNECAIAEGVSSHPAPGHTPGHRILRITTVEGDAVITGDVLHSPVQCAEPDWSPRADHDPLLARQTRRALLEECDRTGTLVCVPHFPAPSYGRVVRSGSTFRFRDEEDPA